MYLTFTDLEDFVTHLRDRRISILFAGISHTSGEPGQFGIQAVSYHAVFSVQISSYIAVTSELLTQTTSVQLQADRQEVRQRMFDRFAELVEELKKQGFTVERGIWQVDAPYYLK